MSDEQRPLLASTCDKRVAGAPCRLPPGHDGVCTSSRPQALWHWRERAQSLEAEWDREHGEAERLRSRLERAEGLLRRWHDYAVSNWHDHTTSNIAADTRAFLAPTPPEPPPPIHLGPPCSKPYGALPALCRRGAGHDGDCGPGTEFEQARAQFWEARERVKALAAKERSGEAWSPEWDDLQFRAAAVPLKEPTCGTCKHPVHLNACPNPYRSYDGRVIIEGWTCGCPQRGPDVPRTPEVTR
jgi:hypothetical protein